MIAIKIGDFLFRHAFFLYNFIYPRFKRRQDRYEIDLIKKILKPGDTVLDIGANIGFYTSFFSALVGKSGKVHCFEPDRLNFQRLKKNTSALDNITLHEAAASNLNGTITLFQSDLLNVDHKTYRTTESESGYSVPSLKLDDLFTNTKIHLIKIDIQGFEYFAFEGLKQTLARNPELKILTEFYPYGIRNSGATLTAFFELFWENGFQAYQIQDDSLVLLKPADLSKFEKLDQGTYFNLLITSEMLG